MCLHSWQHKTAGDNTVLGHQLILYMGRISPCRACRSMSPALEQRRGLPGEPSAGHDCVPCVCPMSSLRLSGRRSSLDPAPCPSPRVNKRPTQRAGETSRQMRCSPGNVGLDGSPWAAVSVAAFSAACGLESWLQCQTPAAIGLALDRHSGSQPVIWCESLVRGAGCRRSISCLCADVGTSCGQCHKEPL